MEDRKKGKMYVISGPAGSGKTTLANLLCKENPLYKINVSFTTRPPREGEQEGIDYFFVSNQDFLERQQQKEFLESISYAGKFYGTSKKWIQEQLDHGFNVLLLIDVRGAKKIKEISPDTPAFFIMPPSVETLENRLKKRSTETEQQINERLKIAAKEIEQAPLFDAIILNNDLLEALDQLKKLLN